MKYFAILIVVIVLGLVLSRQELKAKRKKVGEIFSGRDPLDAESFYERYFRDQGISRDVAVGVRDAMQETLDVDLSRLQSSDDFSKNLKFVWDFDSMADVEMVIAFEKKFNIKIPDKEASQLLTIDDIVKYIDQKVRAKSAS